MSQKHFGTDGIRGRVGKEQITPEFCLRLSWAIGKVFANEKRRPHILIGKDTRISGYMLESVLQSGFVSAGADVSLLGPIPTPAIAHLTRAVSADVGVVISASHNPFYDNGIKLFDGKGNKLGDAVELLIEAMIDQPMLCQDSESLGRASRISDAPGRYVEFCKNTAPREFSLRGVKIVLDCAHGATYQTAPRVFSELGAEVIATAVEPDGFNINEGCGSTHPQSLQQRVIEEAADLGIAFDGDGDRLVMVDADGNLLDGDHLLYVIARSRQRREIMHGGVVGTVMSNLGLERALQSLALPFVRAAVGDRHIMEALHQRQWTLGGEPSGHILTLDMCSTGDAIVAGLQVLVAMQDAGQSLRELAAGLTKAPQVLLNVVVDTPAAVSVHPDLVGATRAHELAMGERGRILVRASGTEPLLRIMVEGEDQGEVTRVAEDLAEHAKGIQNA
ncbi:MAG TPA: phosphoglucosamine mutase [Gammaproteobacteria bacterium]|nr:phosphoglucosamine mutase [Gammaproteobacteria bacterium]